MYDDCRAFERAEAEGEIDEEAWHTLCCCGAIGSRGVGRVPTAPLATRKCSTSWGAECPFLGFNSVYCLDELVVMLPGTATLGAVPSHHKKFRIIPSGFLINGTEEIVACHHGWHADDM